MKTYLCGPINGCTDDEANNWRDLATELLGGKDSVYDPMVRDYRGRELEPGIAAEIVENDKEDILMCGHVLVMYEKPSVGTSMEVLFAWQNEIEVIVVDRSGRPLSPWLVYHSHHVFKTLEEACAYINTKKRHHESVPATLAECRTEEERNRWYDALANARGG